MHAMMIVGRRDECESLDGRIGLLWAVFVNVNSNGSKRCTEAAFGRDLPAAHPFLYLYLWARKCGSSRPWGKGMSYRATIHVT